MEEKVRRGDSWATGGRGLFWRCVCPRLAFPPPIRPFPSRCPWWSWSLLPSPPADAFSFLLWGGSEAEGEEWRVLEQCLLHYQASALESWKGSTWESVPEKTNFRSRLIWEKACVRRAASGTLAGAEAGLGPAFNGSDMEASRAHRGCTASKGDFTLQL